MCVCGGLCIVVAAGAFGALGAGAAATEATKKGSQCSEDWTGDQITPQPSSFEDFWGQCMSPFMLPPTRVLATKRGRAEETPSLVPQVDGAENFEATTAHSSPRDTREKSDVVCSEDETHEPNEDIGQSKESSDA